MNVPSSVSTRIYEDLIVLLHGFRVDTAVARDVGVAREIAVGITHGLEEAREGGDVAGEPLIDDFLLEVVHDIGLQRAFVPRGQVVRRHEAPVENLQEIEVLDLRGDQRVHLVPPGAPAQEVGAAPLELAGARAAEDEAQPPVLDEPVDFVQELGDLLDLIQDHRCVQLVGRDRQEALAEQRRALGELQHEIGLEQVEREALGKRRPEVGALPRLARAPEKGRLPGRQGHPQDPFDANHSGVYSVLVRPNGSLLREWLRLQEGLQVAGPRRRPAAGAGARPAAPGPSLGPRRGGLGPSVPGSCYLLNVMRP
jgi:hypothetical protein